MRTGACRPRRGLLASSSALLHIMNLQQEACFSYTLKSDKKKQQKPELLNAFAIPSLSDLIRVFTFCSDGARLIFAGPRGRASSFVIHDLQSRTHETLAGSLKFIREMWLLSIDNCHWTVPFMSCQWHVLNDACWRHLVQMCGV